MRRHLELEKLIAPLVENMGYRFEGLERLPQGRFSLLRLYIDKPNGVTVDDCGRVSRQVSAMLEVEAAVTGEFTLEVSSPGLDRLLFTVPQFQAQVGKEVNIRLLAPWEGRRNFKGILKAVGEGNLTLFVPEGEGVGQISEWTFDLSNISEARVVPKW